MGIFRVTMKGRNGTFLAKGDSAGKVKDSLVEVKALSAKELGEAFGAPVWTAGNPLPEDSDAQPAADAPEAE